MDKSLSNMCTPDLNTTDVKPVAKAPNSPEQEANLPLDESIYSEEVNVFTLNSSDGKCVTFRICGSGDGQSLTVISPEPVTVKLGTFEDLVNNMLDPSSSESPDTEDEAASQAHTCSHADHCKLHEVYVLQGMTYAFVMVTLALLMLSYLQVMRIRCEA